MQRNIYKCFLISVCVLLGLGRAYGEETSATAEEEEVVEIPLYQGIGVKLDVGNSIYEIAISGGRGMSMEAMVYANLKRKYLPTVEVGYGALTRTANNDAKFSGKGAFMRLGCDFNIMKNKKIENMFLLGVRWGAALQQCSTSNIIISDPYWDVTQTLPARRMNRFDCWGELVGGVQVDVYKGFIMGWNVRVKALFTGLKEGKYYPSYIPGFGHHNNTTFSFNYYIGYKF
jgi:hypothetical protein